MNVWSFWEYDEEQEKIGRDYWEFLDATYEEMIKANIQLIEISKIIKNIQNSKLKEKMKQKVKEIIVQYGITTTGITLDKELFSKEERKEIIEEQVESYLSKEVDISSIKEIMQFVYEEDDERWKLKVTEKIFNMLNEDRQNTSRGINSVEFLLSINDERMKKYIETKYQDTLPKEHKKLKQIEEDENYIQNKIEKFRNIKIGIDPEMIIGLEIEANNSIYRNSKHPYDVIKLQSRKAINKAYYDSTTGNGYEFVTPPFKEKGENIAVFCATCETLEELGYRYDDKQENCAGHINIGLSYLDRTQDILNFYEFFGNAEELLFHIANPEGQLIRTDLQSGRFKPISGILQEEKISKDLPRNQLIEMLTPDNDLGSIGRNKSKAKSLSGLRAKENSVCIRDGERLEIRICNGGTDYKAWIDNIRLFGKIVEVSKKCTDIMNKENILEEEQEILDLKEDLKDGSKTLEEKLFILMDLLFDDDNIKQIYVDRYYTLEEQILRDGVSKYSAKSNAFGVVDFKGNYDLRLNEEEWKTSQNKILEQLRNINSRDNTIEQNNRLELS